MELEQQNIKKYPKWIWVLLYIVLGILAIIIVAAIFGSNIEQDLQRHVKLEETDKGKYVDVRLETGSILDSATTVRISEKHRMNYPDDKKVVIWFYLPGNHKTLTPYSTVMYPDKDYVRDATADRDENGNKFRYTRIFSADE